MSHFQTFHKRASKNEDHDTDRQTTQVEGSIVCAAERSNLCGLKPTVGLVSRDLVIVSKRLGSVGPLARCVKDIAGILGVIAGKCERDPGTNSIPFRQIPDYSAFCRVDGLRGARIGIPRHALRGSPPVAELTPVVASAFETALETLREAGAIIVENTEFEAFDETLESKCPNLVKSSDLKATIKGYFGGLMLNPSGVENIHDLIRYTHMDSREDYPSRGTSTLENAAEAIDDQNSSEFQAALDYVRYLANEGGVGGTLKRHELDAIILPTCVAPIMPAIGGYPILSVPLGFYPEQTEIKWNPRHEMIERGPGLP
jgi:amidase